MYLHPGCHYHTSLLLSTSQSVSQSTVLFSLFSGSETKARCLSNCRPHDKARPTTATALNTRGPPWDVPTPRMSLPPPPFLLSTSQSVSHLPCFSSCQVRRERRAVYQTADTATKHGRRPQPIRTHGGPPGDVPAPGMSLPPPPPHVPRGDARTGESTAKHFFVPCGKRSDRWVHCEALLCPLWETLGQVSPLRSTSLSLVGNARTGESTAKHFFVPCGKRSDRWVHCEALLCPLWEIRVALRGKATAAARAALPIPISGGGDSSVVRAPDS